MDKVKVLRSFEDFYEYIVEKNVNNFHEMLCDVNQKISLVEYFYNLFCQNKLSGATNRHKNSYFFQNCIDINLILMLMTKKMELHVFIVNDIDAKIWKIFVDNNLILVDNLSKINIAPGRHLIFKPSNIFFDTFIIYHGMKNSSYVNFDNQTFESYTSNNDRANLSLFFRPSQILFGDFFNLLYNANRKLPYDFQL